MQWLSCHLFLSTPDPQILRCTRRTGEADMVARSLVHWLLVRPCRSECQQKQPLLQVALSHLTTRMRPLATAISLRYPFRGAYDQRAAVSSMIGCV